MAQQRKTGLGKGLSALLNDNEDIRREPQSRPEPEERINKSLGSVNPIKIEYIEVNPFQPRTEFDSQALEELAESIRLQGLFSQLRYAECLTIPISLYLEKEGYGPQS